MATKNKSPAKHIKSFPEDGNYDVDRRTKEIDELKDKVNGLVKEVKLLKKEREKFDRLRGSIQSAWNGFDRVIESIQEEVGESPTKSNTRNQTSTQKKPSTGDIVGGPANQAFNQLGMILKKESPTKPSTPNNIRKRKRPSEGDIEAGGKEITSIQEEVENPTKRNKHYKPSSGDITRGGREITSIQEEAAESPTKPNTRNQTRKQRKLSSGEIFGGPANQAFS